ncbi:aminodeoxychorismate/anthranilate synthase component II [Lutibacter sp.]|uniref:anthranilate synthase component II n=1 Tax=Lutibacter sp. TaxID=1925666 RepID=UPI003569AA45
MKIIIIDNYDSFTYNLVHLVETITGEYPAVFRNDEITVEEVGAYDIIMLSPGPGIPDEAGILKEVIKTYAATKPIFGVCLGLQAITEVFGGSLENLENVFHGVATTMKIKSPAAVIYKNIPTEFEAARYHSWIVALGDFPEELEITSVDEFGSVMSLQHKKYNISAVQYHPESILTPIGEKIVRNFIEANAQ